MKNPIEIARILKNAIDAHEGVPDAQDAIREAMRDAAELIAETARTDTTNAVQLPLLLTGTQGNLI